MGGKLGPVHLDNPSAFERGAADTFILDGPDLGELLVAVVTCDGSGMRPLWHLDSITVWRDPSFTDPETGVYFPCRYGERARVCAGRGLRFVVGDLGRQLG